MARSRQGNQPEDPPITNFFRPPVCNRINETFQRGYRRGNEVFRPAKVVVNDLSHAETGLRAD